MRKSSGQGEGELVKGPLKVQATPAPQPNAETGREDTRADQAVSPSQYDALLERQSEIVARLDRLERHVEDLTRRLDDSAARPTDEGSTPVVVGASEAAHSGQPSQEAAGAAGDERPSSDGEPPIGDQPPEPAGESAQGPSEPTDAAPDELRQVRLQLNNLAGQLARAEDQLKEVRSHRGQRRRHRKVEERPAWKKMLGG